MSHKSWGVGERRRGPGGGWDQDWDQRGNMEGSKQGVESKRQQLVRDIRGIGGSRYCQDEEEKGEKGNIITPWQQLNTRPASARVSDVCGAGNRDLLYRSTLVFSEELEGISC